MSVPDTQDNRLLTAPVARVFMAQAVPLVLVMLMSGLQNIVDAMFLGHFIGTDALAAVSVIFPVLMTIIALSVLVSGGMSSLLARHLGASDDAAAGAVFAGAHGLALCIALILNLAFAVFGSMGISHLSGGQAGIAEMARTYLAITILATPVQFLLGLHGDAWRNEGRAGLMAVLTVGVTLANIVLNYVLIVMLDLGVAGSAWGTALAQGLGLALLVGLRLRGGGQLSLGASLRQSWVRFWPRILSLGAPVSLGFFGIGVVSATIVATLPVAAGDAFAETVAGYGVVTRILSFTYLPFMAVALAMQAVVGNNVGARLYVRSDAVLRLAAGVGLIYGLGMEILLIGFSPWIGGLFADDPRVVAQVGDILRPMVWLYPLSGPILVLSIYFQAVGQPLRTAILSLLKPFLLSPVLVLFLGTRFGTPTMWYAAPLAEAILAVVAIFIVVASLKQRTTGPGFGLAKQEGMA